MTESCAHLIKLVIVQSCSSMPVTTTPKSTLDNESSHPETDLVLRNHQRSHSGEIHETEGDLTVKPLTEVFWPPEPDPDIFTDPLSRDDPKPLRREELMRIGMSH